MLHLCTRVRFPGGGPAARAVRHPEDAAWPRLLGAAEEGGAGSVGISGAPCVRLSLVVMAPGSDPGPQPLQEEEGGVFLHSLEISAQPSSGLSSQHRFPRSCFSVGRAESRRYGLQIHVGGVWLVPRCLRRKRSEARAAHPWWPTQPVRQLSWSGGHPCTPLQRKPPLAHPVPTARGRRGDRPTQCLHSGLRLPPACWGFAIYS